MVKIYHRGETDLQERLISQITRVPNDGLENESRASIFRLFGVSIRQNLRGTILNNPNTPCHPAKK